MAFIEFDYLPFYVSYEIDAYFRFVLTHEKIVEKFRETLNWFLGDDNYGYEIELDDNDVEVEDEEEDDDEEEENDDAEDEKDDEVNYEHVVENIDDGDEEEDEEFEEIYHKSVELDPVHGYASDWNTTNLKYFMGSIVSQESYFPWYFNENINGWDVSNVINMRSAFGGCKVFNQPLDLWDVSNVEEMGYVF
jgi:hypothetical protein